MQNVIVTPLTMAQIEERVKQSGIPLRTLMNNAGKALANECIKVFHNSFFEGKIVILCGNGNNGGDGFVCANYLITKGFEVIILLMNGEVKSSLAKSEFDNLSQCEVIDISKAGFDISDTLIGCKMVVDCTFGTGFKGDLPNDIQKVNKVINSSQAYIIGCDCPSGVDCTNGYVSENTLKCDKTIFFGFKKLAGFLYPALDFFGETIVVDIGIEKEHSQNLFYNISVLQNDYIQTIFPERKPNSHKGDFGKLLIIAGSDNMTGAAHLAVRAALRSGVGLCTVASTSACIDSISSTTLEPTFIRLKSNNEGEISKENFEKLILRAKDYDCILIGCGMGSSPDTRELICQIVMEYEKTIIIDADGINAIACRIDILRKTKAKVILTPHPAELARLHNLNLSEVLADRINLITDFSAKHNVTLVSKNDKTMICSPNRDVFLNVNGNAGLSRGGSGDVLAGMISAFAANKVSEKDACAMGVYFHGLCADYVAQMSSMTGMLPSDIINSLPFVFKNYER